MAEKECRMKCIEIIRIRLVETQKERLAFIHKLIGGLDQKSIRIFQHAKVDSDLSIHLSFDGPDAGAAASELGSHLVSTLKELGLVNHSIWIELDTEKNKKKRGEDL